MRSRKWWLAVIAAAVVIGGVVLAVNLTGEAGDDQLAATEPSASPSAPEPSDQPSASPSAAPSEPGDGPAPQSGGEPAFWATADDDAVAAVEGYLEASQALLAEPSGSFDPVAAVSVGSALGAAEAQALEFQDLQARISGRSQIVAMAVTDRSLDADPATVVITACLDDSEVTVYTLENPDGTATARRNQEIFTVVYDGSTWKVSERTFAAEPNC